MLVLSASSWNVREQGFRKKKRSRFPVKKVFEEGTSRRPNIQTLPGIRPLSVRASGALEVNTSSTPRAQYTALTEARPGLDPVHFALIVHRLRPCDLSDQHGSS